VIPLLGGWKEWRRQRRNRAFCQSLGPDTRLEAGLERRQAGGELHIGRDGLIRGLLVLERPESRIRIGDRVAVGNGTILDCAQEIVLEDDVILSYDCILADSDNHSLRLSDRLNDVRNWKAGHHDWSKVAMGPIRIRRGAWVGARACILKGVTIGEGAVVGMGSVVTRDVDPFTVVAGNPARLIRNLEKS
jgi:galactoside O-acetyltransferase